MTVDAPAVIADLDTPEDWVAWQNARSAQLAVQDEHPSMADPLAAALRRPSDAVLAVITSVIGASYRSPGAMMCLFGDGTSAGGLTNGCIEGDLAQHGYAHHLTITSEATLAASLRNGCQRFACKP